MLSALLTSLWWLITRPSVIAIWLLRALLELMRGKPMPYKFRPPKESKLIIAFSKRFLLPIFMKLVMKLECIEVSDEDLKRLKAIEGHRAILAPNHPTSLDPVIMFHLSTLLGEDFNYLASWESFYPAFKGWWLQRAGCYSIVRGTADRESFRATRRLLVEGQRKLVIFPEGEASGQNDIVMPFQQGIAQFGFWALEDLKKRGALPPLFLVPIAIKYVYIRDMCHEIDRALHRLERKLKLQPQRNTTLYDRLRRVGIAVIEGAEKAYGVRPQRDASLNDRIQTMKEMFVQRVASALGVTLRPDQPLIERIRELFNAIDRIVYREPTGSDYERMLHRSRQQLAQSLYDDLWRALRFVGIYDGYVRETLSQERFLEVIGRLEWAVFGKETWRGPRKVLVRIGEPINLTEYWNRYKEAKRTTLAEVTAHLEANVRTMLSELVRVSAPLGRVVA